jgi:hypothetical protein
MSAINGHAPVIEAVADGNEQHRTKRKTQQNSRPRRFSRETSTKLPEDLQVPFDPSLVKWRAHQIERTNGTLRGYCFPYFDPRVYEDRLNLLVSPFGWTATYETTTTPRKIVCTGLLTIHGLGAHSAMGEEWASTDNAATSAQAQAFKRSCACFGLGRYLYHFGGVWLDIDGKGRPLSIPTLPGWATPDGWRRGLRADRSGASSPAEASSREGGRTDQDAHSAVVTNNPKVVTNTGKNVVRELRAMEKVLGKALYHGVLASVASVWNPDNIRSISLQRTVLQHMHSAQAGIERAAAAQASLHRSQFDEVLKALEIDSLARINNLAILQKVVTALEKAARGD